MSDDLQPIDHSPDLTQWVRHDQVDDETTANGSLERKAARFRCLLDHFCISFIEELARDLVVLHDTFW